MAADPARPGPQPVIPDTKVSDRVSRIVFDRPQTLEELGTRLKGLTVLQLRYTGDVGGVSQSGPGSSADKAIEELRADTVRQYRAAPLVFMAVIDGKVPAKNTAILGDHTDITEFDSASEKIDRLPAGTLAKATKATRVRQAHLAESGIAAPDPGHGAAPEGGTPTPRAKRFRWSPIEGNMQAFHSTVGPEQDHPRKFVHNMVWLNAEDIADFGDDFGYEHNMSLYNEKDISDWTRPYCNPFDWNEPYENFWAGWADGFKWNAVKYGWNVPGEAAPYWDWDDVTDSCQKLDFTIGIGYPTKLQPRIGYRAWIHAEQGDQSSSPYELVGQKLSNDCNNLGMDPGSSCMGLNDDREGTGSELMVNKNRGWTVPGCVNWNPTKDPVRLENGQPGCPPNG